MMQSGDPFTAALRDIMSLLDSDYQGMIIGGIAVIALGYPRVTTDVDVTVLAGRDDLEKLFERLTARGFVSRLPDAIDFAKSNHVLLMRHQPSGVDIDLTLAMLPFEEEAIANSQRVDFADVEIAIPRVEDLIVYKMIASRVEDLRDVEEIMLRHIHKMDLDRLKTLVRGFSDLLERPEMYKMLEDVIRRIGQ